MISAPLVLIIMAIEAGITVLYCPTLWRLFSASILTTDAPPKTGRVHPVEHVRPHGVLPGCYSFLKSPLSVLRYGFAVTHAMAHTVTHALDPRLRPTLG